MAMDNHAQGADREDAFAITVEFDLVDGAFDAFHRLVSENAALSVEREPGCLRFDVLVPVEAPAARVLLYEIYSSKEAFAFHLKMDHYLSFDQATRAMVRTKTVVNFKLSEFAKGLVSV
jgi:quinol monooxygenase YgiN